jgi:uncharacterized protein
MGQQSGTNPQRNAARTFFISLPVQNLDKSTAFFEQLGFDVDARFTDDNGVCLIVNEHTGVMLLTEPFFARFTNKTVANAPTHTEAILTVVLDSAAAVDVMVKKAFDAGGAPSVDPMDEEGMYMWGFQDLDGHLWEVMWMAQSDVEM